MPEGVWFVIVIDSGVMEWSAAYRDETRAEQALVSFMKEAHPEYVPGSVTNWAELNACFAQGGDDLDFHFLFEPIN